MNTKQFVKEVNALRLANKGKWYTWHGEVNERVVGIKGYGTWLQVFRVAGKPSQANNMERSVSEFKADLTKAVE